MNIVETITDTTTGLVGGVMTGAQDVAITDSGRWNMLYATGGLVVAALAGGLMTWVPFQKVPAGNLVRTGSLAFIGAGLFGY